MNTVPEKCLLVTYLFPGAIGKVDLGAISIIFNYSTMLFMVRFSTFYASYILTLTVALNTKATINS